jgi:hypothetical protein
LTHEYEDEADLVESGVTPILHYDPLGRLIRTDLPNGSYLYARRFIDVHARRLSDGRALSTPRRPDLAATCRAPPHEVWGSSRVPGRGKLA